MIIKTTEDLKSYINKLNSQDYIAIDTEFMRENTYWPRVCLIQVAGEGVEFCIDTLDEGLDLSPFLDILQNERIVKVFHAARQDIEIFHHLTGKIPIPVFDTQIAAMVCGLGDSISYKDLVHALLKANIDKGMRHTDWSKRPLDERQVEYAMGDVIYLREVYKILKSRLSESGREHWIDEEMAHLTDEATYDVDPNEAWHRFKVKGMSPKSLSIVKFLARWRENKAKEKNYPRNHVLKDAIIQEIAAFKPTKLEELYKIRGIKEGNKYSGEILEAVTEGLANKENLKSQVPNTQAKNKVLLEMLKMLLHIKAEEAGVASKIIASNDELRMIADGDEGEISVLEGWRKEVFGNDAIALKEGRLAITYDKEKGRTILRLL